MSNDTKTAALAQALEALEEIALAGMSGTGQESPESMTEWHARQAWKFIGIAARALDPVKAALAAASPAPVAQPLTDEQIDALSDDVFDLIQDVPDELVGSRTWDRMFARAVERAHGIGGAA